MELPRNIEELTPAVLSNVLRTSGAWTKGEIAALNFRAIGGGDALSSSVWRVNVATETGNEISLLVKLQLEGRSPNVDIGYLSEATFYACIGQRAGVSLPTSYFVHWDPETGRYLLVQEFLTDGEPGNSSLRLSPNIVEKELLSLARMNARWWNSNELTSISGLRDAAENNAWVARQLRNPELDQIGKFMSLMGPYLNPALGDYFESMPIWYPELDNLQSRHFTLAHSDASSKNVFYPSDDAMEPVFLDWGFCRVGSTMLEFPPCCMDLIVEDFPRIPAILENYHAELVANGVQNYSLEEAWTDYQVAVIRRSYGAIINTVMGVDNDAQADRLEHARQILPSMEQLVLSCDGHLIAQQLVAKAGGR